MELNITDKHDSLNKELEDLSKEISISYLMSKYNVSRDKIKTYLENTFNISTLNLKNRYLYCCSDEYKENLLNTIKKYYLSYDINTYKSIHDISLMLNISESFIRWLIKYENIEHTNAEIIELRIKSSTKNRINNNKTLTLMMFKSLSEDDDKKNQIRSDVLRLYNSNSISITNIATQLKITNDLVCYILQDENDIIINDKSHIKTVREQTNIKKYGVKCTFSDKNIQAKIQNIRKEHIDEISRKISNSLKNRPLADKIASNKKRINTNLERYGSKFYEEQSYETYDDYTKHVLLNKDNFIEYLLSYDFKDRYISNLISKLSCSYTTLNRYIKRYNCNDLVNRYVSTLEYDIGMFLSDNNIEYEIGNRSILNGLELDIYIPKYHVAIEANGTYWHRYDIMNEDNNYHKHDKMYHYNKSRLCEEQGVRLIHIWEYEWYDERQNPILKNIILSACQQITNKIYARNCTIEIRESKDMKDFFNENNIQGFRGGKFAICLVYNNEIVMSYMMGKAFFGKGKYEWEVIRGATKLNYTVIGGASKIWKYFIRTYNPQSCVYYVDYNYFNGNSIIHLDENFQYIKSQLSYKNWWTKENKVLNRQPHKHKEIMEAYKNKECYPIYNAGTKVYVWDKNNQTN